MRSKIGGSMVVAACAFATVVAGLLAPAVEARSFHELTSEAEAAVTVLFPGATILGVGQEREHGVVYFEVNLRDGEQLIELEVTPSGAVGEVETAISMADLPGAVGEEIDRLTRDATTAEIERHEIRGVPEGGTFIPVDPPSVFYEVEYLADGVRREIALTPDGRTAELRESGDDDSDDEDDEDDAH